MVETQGAELHYTATFIFTPCALPAPMPPGTHQTYCREGNGAMWLMLHGGRWKKNSTHAANTSDSSCAKALLRACPDGGAGGGSRGVLKCDACIGGHQSVLREAECTADEVLQWCQRQPQRELGEQPSSLRARELRLKERELAVWERELRVRELELSMELERRQLRADHEV